MLPSTNGTNSAPKIPMSFIEDQLANSKVVILKNEQINYISMRFLNKNLPLFKNVTKLSFRVSNDYRVSITHKDSFIKNVYLTGESFLNELVTIIENNPQINDLEFVGLPPQENLVEKLTENQTLLSVSFLRDVIPAKNPVVNRNYTANCETLDKLFEKSTSVMLFKYDILNNDGSIKKRTSKYYINKENDLTNLVDKLDTNSYEITLPQLIRHQPQLAPLSQLMNLLSDSYEKIKAPFLSAPSNSQNYYLANIWRLNRICKNDSSEKNSEILVLALPNEIKQMIWGYVGLKGVNHSGQITQ